MTKTIFGTISSYSKVGGYKDMYTVQLIFYILVMNNLDL